MKHIMKMTALMLVLVLAVALTGCHMTTPATVLTVQETEIPAGLYLMYQLQAYSTASGKLAAGETDVLKATIEEKPAAEWIHEETLRLARRYAHIENEFAAAGLTLSSEELASANTQIATSWKNSEELLGGNGIGQESYGLFYLNETKYEKLLTAYIEENSDSISDADAKAYMDSIYSHVQTASLPVTDTDSVAVSEENLAAINALAEELKGKLAADGDMDELAPDYLEQAFEICGREYTDEVPAQYVTTTFVNEDYTSFPEDMLAEILAAKVGDAGVYMLNVTPFIWQKVPNYTSDADFDAYRDAMVNNMAVEAFDEIISADSAALEVVENASAVNAYSVKKIKM